MSEQKSKLLDPEQYGFVTPLSEFRNRWLLMAKFRALTVGSRHTLAAQFNPARAMKEGWLLSETINQMVEIMKYDDDPCRMFASDEAAEEWVFRCALKHGSMYHIAALTLITTTPYNRGADAYRKKYENPPT